MLSSVHSWAQTLPAKTIATCTIAAFSASFTVRRYASRLSLKELEKDRQSRAIVITGCDSGLGYAMTTWAASLQYTVLAGCLQPNGEGAQSLRRNFPDRVNVVELDVTSPKSLKNFEMVCKDMLEQQKQTIRLWAVIANAAVCTLGEFMWLTPEQCKVQMDVNFWGTVNFISEFRSQIFDNKARVIVISSDCSNHPLPYLSIYCASKAALDTWTRSFRYEVAKYGVHVVSYHPRDFAKKSGLFSNFTSNYNQMIKHMSESEKTFYGDYFHKFIQKKQEVFDSTLREPSEILKSQRHRENLIFMLEKNIGNISIYKDFSWSEKVFHFLYDALPQRQVDKFVADLLNPDSKTIYWKPQV